MVKYSIYVASILKHNIRWRVLEQSENHIKLQKRQSITTFDEILNKFCLLQHIYFTS